MPFSEYETAADTVATAFCLSVSPDAKMLWLVGTGVGIRTEDAVTATSINKRNNFEKMCFLFMLSVPLWLYLFCELTLKVNVYRFARFDV